MADVKHTPGPWRLSAPGRICYVTGPDRQYILMRDSKKTWDKTAAARIVADCTLIAAAPDLLEALHGLMELERRGRLMPIGAEWDKARAAIAKATGAARATEGSATDAAECTCAAKDMPFGRCCKAGSA